MARSEEGTVVVRGFDSTDRFLFRPPGARTVGGPFFGSYCVITESEPFRFRFWGNFPDEIREA
jgi:hypothetical protein